MKKIYSSLVALALLVPAMTVAGEEKVCSEDVATCARQMAEHFRKRGWVGINMKHDEERDLVVIDRVIPNSPGEAAGLRAGDVLRGLNGIDYDTKNEEALKKAHESFRPGASATFTVERQGQRLDIEVQLGEIPEEVLAQWIGHHVLEYHTAKEKETDKEKAGDGP